MIDPIKVPWPWSLGEKKKVEKKKVSKTTYTHKTSRPAEKKGQANYDVRTFYYRWMDG